MECAGPQLEHALPLLPEPHAASEVQGCNLPHLDPFASNPSQQMLLEGHHLCMPPSSATLFPNSFLSTSHQADILEAPGPQLHPILAWFSRDHHHGLSAGTDLSSSDRS